MMRKKTMEIIGGLAILLIACLVITPAAAWPWGSGYSVNGPSLVNVENDTFKGEIYCSAGSKYGLGLPATPARPYLVNFTGIPTTGTLEWAYLLTGVWGGTEFRTGYSDIDVKNGGSDYWDLAYESLNKDDNPSPENVTGNGNGKWLIANDVTQYINGNEFDVKVVNSGSIDGSCYGVVLVAAFSNPAKNKTRYWLNIGSRNLHYDYENTALTVMGGTAYSSEVATLYAMQYVGTLGENDSVHFNAPSAVDSPNNPGYSNLSWDRDTYAKYMLGDDFDLADGNYFDLDKLTESYDGTPVSDLVNLVGDNEVLFWRGHDTNGSGKIDSAWVGGTSEGEAYVNPVFALLVQDDIWRTYDFSAETPGTAGTCLTAYYNNTFVNNEGNRRVKDLVDNPFGSYTEIEADDSDYKETESTIDYKTTAQRFRFCCIDETDATSLKITWNGYGYDTANGAIMYIWNNCTAQYESVDTDSSTSGEITLSGTRSPTTCYIVDGCVNVLVVQNGVTDSMESQSTLGTDYIVLEVVPNVT